MSATVPELESASAEEVLAYGVERFHPRLTLACSFQKEESVLFHMLSQLDPEFHAFTIDTGVLFPETLDHLEAVRGALPGLQIEVIDARSPGEPWTQSNCCSAAKVAALERALSDVDAWVTGLRREQAPTRAATPKLEHDERRGIWKLNPLADWSEKEIWSYIFEHDLPYNPLHDEGYASIGCAPCTLPGRGPRGPLGGRGQDRVRHPRGAALDVRSGRISHLPDGVTASKLSGVMTPFQYELSHLQALEAESIHIFREVAAEFERPVLLFSGGKDSIVLLRLAEKAFRPGRFPFPIMHVDTGHNFPEVIEFRDRIASAIGERLIVASVQDSIDNGRVAEETGPRASRNRLQTTTLLDAIEEHGFDAAFGGARRDEERARAKERVFSFRDDFGQWDPKNQRPELWTLYNGRIRKGEHVRVFPISNWTELDVWQYIATEKLEIPSIYFAHERAGVRPRRDALRRQRRSSS